jgi:hypothetical protein
MEGFYHELKQEAFHKRQLRAAAVSAMQQQRDFLEAKYFGMGIVNYFLGHPNRTRYVGPEDVVPHCTLPVSRSQNNLGLERPRSSKTRRRRPATASAPCDTCMPFGTTQLIADFIALESAAQRRRYTPANYLTSSIDTRIARMNGLTLPQTRGRINVLAQPVKDQERSRLWASTSRHPVLKEKFLSSKMSTHNGKQRPTSAHFVRKSASRYGNGSLSTTLPRSRLKIL